MAPLWVLPQVRHSTLRDPGLTSFTFSARRGGHFLRTCSAAQVYRAARSGHVCVSVRLRGAVRANDGRRRWLAGNVARAGRRADHRRRRVGRGDGLEPGRDAHEHPLPGAGRLDGSGRLSGHARRTGRRASSATSPSAPTSAGGARTIRSTTATRRSPVSMFNAVGGSTILYAAHFPRFHPCRLPRRARSTASPTTGRSTTGTLEPYYDLNARMMGVSGLAGDPAYPPKELPLPPVALGKLGDDAGARLQPTSAGTGGPPTAPSPRRSTKAARRASTPARA